MAFNFQGGVIADDIVLHTGLDPVIGNGTLADSAVIHFMLGTNHNKATTLLHLTLSQVQVMYTLKAMKTNSFA